MTRFHRRFVFLALAATALACAKGDAPPADSIKRLAASPPATVGAPASVMPGALTKAIDSYTGDELYEFVRKLQFSGGQERERKCKNDPACSNARSPKQTRVAVDAVTLQDSIAAGNTRRHEAEIFAHIGSEPSVIKWRRPEAWPPRMVS